MHIYPLVKFNMCIIIINNDNEHTMITSLNAFIYHILLLALFSFNSLDYAHKNNTVVHILLVKLLNT